MACTSCGKLVAQLDVWRAFQLVRGVTKSLAVYYSVNKYPEL